MGVYSKEHTKNLNKPTDIAYLNWYAEEKNILMETV